MRIQVLLKRFAILACATVLAVPALADDAPADRMARENVVRDAARPATPLPVELIRLADSVAKFGRTNRDPLSLIVAAGLLQKSGAKVVARPPDGADAAADVVAGDGGLSVEALLKEATTLSKNDATIVALANDVKASATKGRVDGGIITLGQIAGNTVQSRTLDFAGNRPAEVAAMGIDSNDIKLEIFDEGGHLICRDTDPAYCRFNPIWTGPFTLKVRNDGVSLAHYRLETN